MALNLALFIGSEGLTFGAIAGFLTGFGWVFFAIGIISLFENRPFNYVLINGGYMTVAFTRKINKKKHNLFEHSSCVIVL